MVTEFFLNIVFNIVEWLLEGVPQISIVFESTSIQFFMNIVAGVLYMLPVHTISAIVSLIVAISLFRIFVSIGKTIWELLPIV